MTYADFVKAFRESVPDSYEVAIPVGASAGVAINRYGARSTQGDDRNQLDLPKVQLDILTTDPGDILLDAVTGTLWLLDQPYEIVDQSYDPDFGRYRTIIQLVVM